MIGEEFLRDFFGMRPASPYTALCDSYTKAVVDEAMMLAKGQPPEANLMPYIQIVLDAKRLGLTLRRSGDQT